ncbi:MAG TPA: class I SAM-dependent methyltransferase [Patescibacteria group bacterium]|nr:class I SAM-dependent methyltransferase [Patescibacteria group bacterium]
MDGLKTEVLKKNDNIGEKLSEKELCPDDLLQGQEEAFARDIARLQQRTGEFLKVHCPACGSNSAFKKFEKHTFNYDECENCRTIYMNPRPSPKVMEWFYQNSENYEYWAKHIFPASEASRKEKIHKPWLERIVSYCKRFGIPQNTLVEIGAGFGTFSAVAQESGAFKNVFAIEPNPGLAQACRERGVHVVNLPVERITNEMPQADVAVSFEVIEHLFKPEEFLQQCKRILRPGGLLVISCPNGLGFDIATLGAESLAVDPEHVNLFNPQSLSILLKSCGFEVLSTTTPGRLDAEFVRTAILENRYDVSQQAFLKTVLLDEWETLGWNFQQFLAENGLSAHMWCAARLLEK